MKNVGSSFIVTGKQELVKGARKTFELFMTENTQTDFPSLMTPTVKEVEIFSENVLKHLVEFSHRSRFDSCLIYY